MNSTLVLCEASRSCHRTRRASVLIAAAFVAGTPSVAIAAAEISSTPPAFPDVVHVTRGCYLSTLAYIARFRVEYPAESVRPLTVSPRNFSGPHTIAVLTWKGRWWGRDEYSGVFALACPVSRTIDLNELRDRATVQLGRLATHQLKTGRLLSEPDGIAGMPCAAREFEVARAAKLAPCVTAVIRVRCQGCEIPFLFIEPEKGRIAIYDPATGTATADLIPINVAGLVTQVATRLGYRVDGTSTRF